MIDHAADPPDPGRARLLSAAWFGLWGAGAAGIVYLVPALDPPRLGPLTLYVLLPGMAGAAAGALLGPTILAREGAEALEAAGLGLAAAVVAHLLFGPLFAAGSGIFYGVESFWGLAMLASGLGLPMMGIYTLPAGMVAGWLLFLMVRGRG